MKARSAIRSLAFNPKRRVVAAGSADGTISLWDVAARKKIAETTPGSQSVESVAFSPNGEVLVTAGDDGTLRFWDVDTLLPLGRPLTAHAGAIRSLASSRDASLLASAGDDGTVRLWSGILWPDTAALTNRICGLIAGGITAAEWDSILRRVSTVAAARAAPEHLRRLTASPSDATERALVADVEEVDPAAAQPEPHGLARFGAHVSFGFHDEARPARRFDRDQRLAAERFDVLDPSLERPEQPGLRVPETRVSGRTPTITSAGRSTAP